MNKKIFFTLFLALFLVACGNDSSWEEEEVKEVSSRILSEDVEVKWELEEIQASQLIRLQITNMGQPIEEFDINHEKLLHLIIASKDLSYFNHIHPEYKGGGVFEIRNDFPAGGEYRVIADFKPADGDSVSKMEWLSVKGDSAKTKAITVDNSLEKLIDGKKVTLSIDPQAEVGKELTLKFTITDETSNQPITNLEPYLGAIGHVVVLSQNGERYLHVHAIEGQGNGPEALFETEFPQSGVYKIWGQFQHEGKVFTVPYVINIP